jgi:hypothetical protein
MYNVYVSYSFGGRGMGGGEGATIELLCHGGLVQHGVLPSLAGGELPAAVSCTVIDGLYRLP